ncbi:MAG: DUF4382 domain-containing protein [Dehalococcoidales bacterium]|nr:DUF4382 domain-containing protein [Dehalococcoidales bacterium]
MRIIAGSLIVLLAALALTIIGCTPAETGPGTIDVVVTSTIVEEGVSGSETEIEISSIEATVSEIKVYRGGVIQGEGGEQGEWVNLYVASIPINLLQNSSQEQFLAFASVAATSYDQIVMVIDRLNVTLSNGSEITITPNEPFDFTASFVVYAEKTTTIIFKFNIDKSVTFTDDNKTTIKPLAGITLNVRYEEMD